MLGKTSAKNKKIPDFSGAFQNTLNISFCFQSALFPWLL